MKREEFVEMLNAISESWQKRDYARAVSFYAENVRYADPLNYRFYNRADLQKFFENDEGFEQKTLGTTSSSTNRNKSAQSNTLTKEHIAIMALR